MSIFNQTMHIRSKLAASVSLALALFGCGGTGQDKGEASSTPQVIQGVAIDGYLARSTVFMDYDNNRTRDPWEPFAFTDDDGYFSYNPLTQTDYCTASTPARQRLFCLRTNRALSGAVIRIDGGYDVMTGEPFFGQLSRRLEQTQQGPVVISPLTSLLADIRTEAQKNTLLAAMNITLSDLDRDYFNVDGSISAPLLSLALRLHKAVSVISQSVHAHYDEIGSKTGAMNDVSATIYNHLAAQLGRGVHSLDEIIGDPVILSLLIAQTELDVLDYYDKWELQPPANNGSAIDIATLADHALGLSQLTAHLLSEDFTSDPAAIRGAIKLIEAMTLKASGIHKPSFRGSINYLLNADNRALLNELITALAGEDANLTALSNLDIADGSLNSSEAIDAATRLPAGTSAFRDLAGMQMRVSDMDLGSGPNRLRDSEVELYFHGNDGDTEGEFDACVKYIKDASITGKLGDANTRGELVKGHWGLLGAATNDGASYSLLLTLDFLGSKYQAILKPAAAAAFAEREYRGIRFDYANELRTWYSEAGVERMQSLPQSAADCAARLPSRIGI
jgi:hypothetical protein